MAIYPNPVIGEMIPITLAMKSNEMIETTDGYYTALKWVEKEAARIMKGPGRRAEVRICGDMVALYADRVA